MISIVEQQLDAIRALCEEFGVQRLELIGSATTGAFDPERSDLDFLIEYPPGYDFGPWLTRHIELRERLSVLLGRPVDLVMPKALRNPYVIRSINETRQVLYSSRDLDWPDLDDDDDRVFQEIGDLFKDVPLEEIEREVANAIRFARELRCRDSA